MGLGRCQHNMLWALWKSVRLLFLHRSGNPRFEQAVIELGIVTAGEYRHF
jgi:hypothetical protein